MKIRKHHILHDYDNPDTVQGRCMYESISSELHSTNKMGFKPIISRSNVEIIYFFYRGNFKYKCKPW